MPAAKSTIKQAADAIWKAHGNVTKAAKLLGVSRTALSGRIGRHQTLKKAKREASDSLLDLAEDALWSLVADKNLGAVCFALKCQGKERGWVERQEITGKDGGAVSVTQKTTIDYSKLSTTDLETLKTITEKAIIEG